MPAKKKPAKSKKPKAPELPQGERFKRFARSVGADDPDALDRAFGGADLRRQPPKTEKDG